MVWNSCLEIIRDNVPSSTFKIWFDPIKVIGLDESTLTVEVPSEFFREYLEEHFLNLLSKTLRRVIGPNAKLVYNVEIIKDNPVKYPQQSPHEVNNKPVTSHKYPAGISNPFVIPGLQKLEIKSNLNPNYSFDNFIEGECNRLARSAGLSIAKNPGKNTFNPLFLYGGPGLGKTHLGQAIGIEIKERFPEKIVLYVAANRFQTQFMDAVNIKNKLTDFINFYQMIDVLIIDDVHEFADKPGTQNAFFHIFNHLHQSGKQLVLTSDRPPVDLQGLEQRLLSRFKWGLSAELTPPDKETRIAILKEKSFKEGITLPDEVLDYIASRVKTNIRELEGMLVSLMAHATLTKKKITLQLAQEVIDSIVNIPPVSELTIGKIQTVVCNYFSIPSEILLSKTRKREIVQARQIAMYFSRNMTKNSLASIGAQLGGKDHATVLHAYTTVCDLMDTDNSFRQYVTDIEKQLSR